MGLGVSKRANRIRRAPPPPPPKPAKKKEAAATPSPTQGREAPTRPTPSAAAAATGRLQFAADTALDQRRRQLEAALPTGPAAISAVAPEPSAVTATGTDASPEGVAPAHQSDGFESVETDPLVQQARDSYDELSDPEQLAARFEEEPNLNNWDDIDIHALAAVAIDVPESHDAIAEAVDHTIDEAETLEDIPNNAGFQFLVDTTVYGEDQNYGAAGRLNTLVEQQIQTEFDEAFDGARGDGEFDEGLEDYSERVQDLVTDYPVLFDDIEDNFTGVLDANADRIQDIRRADDPWYADINHAITGGIRGAAGWVADELFPLPPGNSPGRILGNFPGSDFLNSPSGVALREFGIGATLSGRGFIEGPAELITNPVGTAQALVAAVRDPSLLLEGYKQTAEEYGNNAALGHVGFDFLFAYASVAATPNVGLLGSTGRAGRLLNFPGSQARRWLDADFRVADDLRQLDNFDSLPDPIQELAVSRAISIPDGQAFVTRIVDSDGFRALDLPEQDRLLRIAGSQDPYIGIPGRNALDDLLQSDDFARLTPTQQTAQLRRFVDEQPGTGHSPLAPEGTYRPAEFELSQPTQTFVDFADNDGALAQRRVVTVDGQDIEILGPLVGPHDLEQIAASVASLPPAARSRVTRVVLEPEAHPFDATLENGLTTHMTAGVDGTVRVYPSAATASFDQLTDTLVHEAGHLLSFDELGPNRFDPAARAAGGTGQVYEGAGWDRWREAADSDGVRSSQYAAADIGEDFAETYRLYVSTRGSPYALELRALMPERFAFLDELTQGGL